jgi:hypothetical protein
LALVACEPHDARERDAQPAEERVSGDATRGAALAVRFECARCHVHAALTPAPSAKNCAECHAQLARGELDVGADAATQALWRERATAYLSVPPLTHTGARLRRSALAALLREPHEVRPHLPETMPRLRLTADDAADLATWLAPEDEAQSPAIPDDRATVARGQRLVEDLGCGLCHERGGERLPARALRVQVPPDVFARAFALAPDLAEVSTRVRRDRLVQWLLEPRSIDVDATMPALPRSRAEAEAIAAWLLYAPVLPRAPRPVPARLPLLARRVTFAEVQARVFGRSCWHCHAEPDFADGDGGPGNTGGLGFPPRGLSLVSASAIRSGARGDDGLRRSVLAQGATFTPRLVEALLARQREEAGEATELRGMPLGLPALSGEDVQLVESWAAGGAGN